MAEEIIDLTKSDDEVAVIGQSGATERPQSRTRRGARRGARHGKNQAQSEEDSDDVQLIQPSGESLRTATRGDRDTTNKERDDKPKSEPSKSSGTSASLLSRIGAILHENDKDNNTKSGSGKSKRGSRGRAPAESNAQDRAQADEPPAGSLRSPKEIPLSELPVDQLFFIDTGPNETNGSTSVETSPLGTTGFTTPNPSAGPGTGTPNAKSLKRKLAKERKKERKVQEENKVPGDTVNDVEFIGGSALVVDHTIPGTTVTQSEGQVIVETVAATIAPDATGGTTVELSLPSHVTVLWLTGMWNGPGCLLHTGVNL